MPEPNLSFVANATPEAQKALRLLQRRYGHVPPAEADVVVALGGDGLMLQALHRSLKRQTPIYGMNLGTVGFLMNQYRPAGLIGRIHRARRIALTPLRMIATTTRGQTREAIAINEVSLFRSSRQTARISISVDRQERLPELYCDGIMVATSAGSTAYNLSAHGPIVLPSVDARVPTPIAPHALTYRPVILPATARVTLRSTDLDRDDLVATFDGQFGVNLAPGDTVQIARAERQLTLLRVTARSHFDVLRDKLRWG